MKVVAAWAIVTLVALGIIGWFVLEAFQADGWAGILVLLGMAAGMGVFVWALHTVLDAIEDRA